MSKHYIRLDSNNNITHGFSTDFEQPIETDICINEDGERQFELNGKINPSLNNIQGRYNYKFIDNKVIEKTEEEKVNIDDLKQEKINELSQKCNETIINGFYSDADGTKKLYDFELENQVNLSTKAYQIQIAKLAGQPIVTVSYYAKSETCHDYTSDQFLKLAQDGEAWKTSNIVKYKDKLKPMVEACATVEAVNAITWDTIV